MFYMLSTLTAVVTGLLFLISLGAPELLLWLMGVSESESAAFVARRMAMVFLGLTLICWLNRDCRSADVHKAIAMGLLVMLLGLAALGLFELLRGYAGYGILLAVVTELLLGIAWGRVCLLAHRSRLGVF
ncbi:hypothetical protein [Oceanobacter sp. 4_MG-2023]|uniref:hypothetical protein n=1 Tax=Oceanobacter sp. 4_MG-2023 TaxID=3062623 RepID=UPI002734020D|nr:hypothetical protein [Oceanobacter sp. 4_MG-2023]MDP2547816.1 hypothetical protein [Oceanobacter sp. 4_MG-2023]